MLLCILHKCLECLWRIDKKLVVVIASGKGYGMAGVMMGGKLFTSWGFFKNVFIYVFLVFEFSPYACTTYSKINYFTMNKNKRSLKNIDIGEDNSSKYPRLDKLWMNVWKLKHADGGQGHWFFRI